MHVGPARRQEDYEWQRRPQQLGIADRGPIEQGRGLELAGTVPRPRAPRNVPARPSGSEIPGCHPACRRSVDREAHRHVGSAGRARRRRGARSRRPSAPVPHQSPDQRVECRSRSRGRSLLRAASRLRSVPLVPPRQACLDIRARPSSSPPRRRQGKRRRAMRATLPPPKPDVGHHDAPRN
jgi:hypothetical protein